MPFEDVTNDQAYLKAGAMGLAGSGKTYTGAKVLIGLRAMLVERGVLPADEPIYMLDTEVGSSWLRPLMDEAGVRLKANKTRAFRDLVDGINLVADRQGLLLIDSITHFWKELCEAYAKKHNRTRMTFQDWGNIKGTWSSFTDLYINATAHVWMNGRQGYEYDFFEDDDGKKQLEKTGLKMKGEAETGYEPSLLMVLERHQELGTGGSIDRVWRTAYILKDRGRLIDGKCFENPTIEDFLPHINQLNLGGEHRGVDTTRTSESLFKKDDDSWKREQQAREILLEEFQELLKKHYPSQSSDDKQYRLELIEKFCNTRSWKKVELFGLNELKTAYSALHLHLEKKPAPSEMQTTASVQTPF